MSTKKDDQQEDAPVEQTGGGMSADLTAASRAQARDMAEAERNKLDETVPGGRYEVNGRIVNAYGEPVKKGTTAADLERMRREQEIGAKLVE